MDNPGRFSRIRATFIMEHLVPSLVSVNSSWLSTSLEKMLKSAKIKLARSLSIHTNNEKKTWKLQ